MHGADSLPDLRTECSDCQSHLLSSTQNLLDMSLVPEKEDKLGRGKRQWRCGGGEEIKREGQCEEPAHFSGRYYPPGGNLYQVGDNA